MKLVFLLDVDNTLLDHDRAKSVMEADVAALIGLEHAQAFWHEYEMVRQEFEYVDFLHSLERFRKRFPNLPNFGKLADLVLCYPYGSCLYPGALETVAHLRRLGTVGILSDGDPIFQSAKIARAGLADAVAGNVLIYAHKEDHLADVQRALPGDRYVMIDDKPRILVALRERMGDRVVTVQVNQGKYAHQPHAAADLTVDRIGDLAGFDQARFLEAGDRAAASGQGSSSV